MRNAKLWWYLPWSVKVVAKILKAFTIRVQINIDKFISSNLLECVTNLINYAATTEVLLDGLITSAQPNPVAYIDADNTTVVSWTKKQHLQI